MKFLLEIQILLRTSGFVRLGVKITPQTSSSLSKVPLWLSSDSPLTSHTSLLATNDQQFPKKSDIASSLLAGEIGHFQEKNGQAPIFVIFNNLAAYRQLFSALRASMYTKICIFPSDSICGGGKGVNLWRSIVKNFREHFSCKSCL